MGLAVTLHNLRDAVQRECLALLRDVAYPMDCPICHTPSPPGRALCPDCSDRLPLNRENGCAICGAEAPLPEGERFICADCLRARPAYEKALIAGRYSGDLRKLIINFKYHRALWLAPDFIEMLTTPYLLDICAKCVSIDLVLPVPMLPQKERLRGYNQAEVLARAFAHDFHLPLNTRTLRRIRTADLTQTRLHRSERLKNAIASYRLRNPKAIKDKTLLLIDDVITTGATVNACATLLKEAGARAVYVAAIARPYTP